MLRPLVLALAAVLFAAAAHAAPVRVQTASGVLVGEGADGINVFRGVPYARPPVGPLRWREPQPIRWSGERQATQFALPCLQETPASGFNGAGVSGPSSEDCLYLNLWAPANARGAPVMVWVYGGGGTMGSGHVATYHGDRFARDGVVLITLNYRLGALAGFAHPAIDGGARGEAFGNYHLLDVLAVLRWVQDNARAFGGDPGNVTLFGESAGGTIVANLVASPMARGLMHKAIIQSTGSLPTPGTPLDRAHDYARASVASWGLGPNATAAQLRAVPAERVIGGTGGGGLRTILDGRIAPASIMDIFQAGRENDIPLIVGSNSDEGRLAGTQAIATYAMTGAPAWQYFFDYVPDWRRADQPNGVPHAGEIPYAFATVRADRRGGENATARDEQVAERVHSCWVAFAWAPPGARTLICADGFHWPARSDAGERPVAVFQEYPSLTRADLLRSPPNGARPGSTSRP